MLEDLRAFGKYAQGLGDYLRTSLTPEECRGLISRQAENREQSFLSVLQHGVYGHSSSPYRKLLEHADITYEDVAELVRRHGIEPTLRQLYEAGVYVTVDEFKVRRRIERGGLSFAPKSTDFDNPLLTRHYAGQTGGSRGSARRILIDFDLLTHEAAYTHLFLDAYQLHGRPIAQWLPMPPGSAGMKHVLRYARLGVSTCQWFSPSRVRWTQLKNAAFTGYTIVASRAVGFPIPIPRRVPLSEALEISKWLAEQVSSGQPAVMTTYVSAGIRLCRAALESGVDISGTFFRLIGEPLTPAKAKIIEASGCQLMVDYSMAEAGILGLGCATPTAVDDIHLMTEKVAVIQQSRRLSKSRSVDIMAHTTLLPCSPKIMLNVDSDDYGLLERKQCGCPLGQMGFNLHVSHIRSHEKLTSEGVSFLGNDLIRLLEEELPSRFGGGANDYQLVEHEDAGLTRVELVVNPSVGEVSEHQLTQVVYDFLRAVPDGDIMANEWQQGQTLRVVRREPLATGATKVLPLHVAQ